MELVSYWTFVYWVFSIVMLHVIQVFNLLQYFTCWLLLMAAVKWRGLAWPNMVWEVFCMRKIFSVKHKSVINHLLSQTTRWLLTLACCSWKSAQPVSLPYICHWPSPLAYTGPFTVLCDPSQEHYTAHHQRGGRTGDAGSLSQRTPHVTSPSHHSSPHHKWVVSMTAL